MLLKGEQILHDCINSESSKFQTKQKLYSSFLIIKNLLAKFLVLLRYSKKYSIKYQDRQNDYLFRKKATSIYYALKSKFQTIEQMNLANSHVQKPLYNSKDSYLTILNWINNFNFSRMIFKILHNKIILMRNSSNYCIIFFRNNFQIWKKTVFVFDCSKSFSISKNFILAQLKQFFLTSDAFPFQSFLLECFSTLFNLIEGINFFTNFQAAVQDFGGKINYHNSNYILHFPKSETIFRIQKLQQHIFIQSDRPLFIIPSHLSYFFKDQKPQKNEDNYILHQKLSFSSKNIDAHDIFQKNIISKNFNVNHNSFNFYQFLTAIIQCEQLTRLIKYSIQFQSTVNLFIQFYTCSIKFSNGFPILNYSIGTFLVCQFIISPISGKLCYRYSFDSETYSYWTTMDSDDITHALFDFCSFFLDTFVFPRLASSNQSLHPLIIYQKLPKSLSYGLSLSPDFALSFGTFFEIPITVIDLENNKIFLSPSTMSRHYSRTKFDKKINGQDILNENKILLLVLSLKAELSSRGYNTAFANGNTVFLFLDQCFRVKINFRSYGYWSIHLYTYPSFYGSEVEKIEIVGHKMGTCFVQHIAEFVIQLYQSWIFLLQTQFIITPTGIEENKNNFPVLTHDQLILESNKSDSEIVQDLNNIANKNQMFGEIENKEAKKRLIMVQSLFLKNQRIFPKFEDHLTKYIEIPNYLSPSYTFNTFSSIISGDIYSSNDINELLLNLLVSITPSLYLAYHEFVHDQNWLISEFGPKQSFIAIYQRRYCLSIFLRAPNLFFITISNWGVSALSNLCLKEMGLSNWCNPHFTIYQVYLHQFPLMKQLFEKYKLLFELLTSIGFKLFKNQNDFLLAYSPTLEMKISTNQLELNSKIFPEFSQLSPLTLNCSISQKITFIKLYLALVSANNVGKDIFTFFHKVIQFPDIDKVALIESTSVGEIQIECTVRDAYDSTHFLFPLSRQFVIVNSQNYSFSSLFKILEQRDLSQSIKSFF